MTDATKAVFISYAREDTATAQRIAEALRSQGVEVWFDQNELRGGEAWDAKIRRQIKECALFLPVVSANTQGRAEGYFRLEWELAEERTHLMIRGTPFILPIVIDDTTEAHALVPDRFREVQWMRLPDALPTPQLIEQVKRLVAPAPRQAALAARHVSADPPVVGRALRARPWAMGVAVVGGLLLVVAGVFFNRRNEMAARRSAPPTSENSAAAKPPLDFASAKSIAVLPFTNMSDDKEASAFFADGMHEDILTDLSNIRELRVTSRTTAEQYRGTKKTLRQIGQELGVAYVLEGSVRRAGGKVRVTAQLIDARTDEHVWANKYDRDLSDIFSIQSELAQAIAGELKLALSPQEKSLIERRQGRWTESLGSFRMAVQLDPGNLRTAFDLASLLAAGRRFDETQAQQRRIVERLPDDLDTNFELAYLSFLATGATREMEDFVVRLPAHQANSDRGIALRKRWALLHGDVAEVVRLDRIEHYPGVTGALAMAVGLATQGDVATARARLENYPVTLRSAVEREPNSHSSWAILGQMEALLGHKDDALRCARKAMELLPESRDAVQGARYRAALAFVEAWTGDKDAAIANYARLLRIPYFSSAGGLNFSTLTTVHVMKHDPRYAPLRGDPRFEALLNDPKNHAPLF
ncbi:MAG: TIR domain-containing protein [Verrucomicrobia bacterium]|nr:TIR domain-containing protein [Verrucomicrobiota bacterium]